MKTGVCMATCIRSEKRLDDLKRVLDSMVQNLAEPAEVVIVDDCSTLTSQVDEAVSKFVEDMKKEQPSINVIFIHNETNLKPSKTFNKAMQIALSQPTPSDVLIHIEDDIVVDHRGWNQVFAKFLKDHPEVGQVLPHGSGRSEWIPRPDYDEFPWGIGGLWAIPREVFEKIGGWDETLVHQHEPDYNIRVRMAGWRLGQLNDFGMLHLGEGDLVETFEYQAQQHIGVYNFLKKWNRRFFGTVSYRDIWLMSFEDFPINVAFRRQLAAWFVVQGNEDCRMNQSPETFIYPGHWGKYELVKLIRSPHRERERDLIERMRNNYVFRDEPHLHTHIKSLADRLNHPMTNEEVTAYIKDRECEYDWKYDARWL